MSKKRGLTGNEKNLWRRVVEDVSPLDKALTQDEALEKMADLLRLPGKAPRGTDPAQSNAAPQTRPSAQPYLAQRLGAHSSSKGSPVKSHSVINTGDPRTAKRVSRGRVEIDATLDLHGLTQEQAFTLLATFLARARAAQHRHLLVVTGKGPPAQREAPDNQVTRGILRRRFLEWVDGPFKDQISSVRQAAQHHGGAGAFYIFLTSKKPAP